MRSRWKELLRDRERPARTAAAAAIGAFLGATPILGVHTWMALGSATLLRLPPIAALAGSNLSNPLTFVPLTLLEIRVGSWILDRPFHVLPSSLGAGDLGRYVAEAWVGWLPVGLTMAAGSYLVVRLLLWRSRGSQDRAASGSSSE